MSAFSQGTDEIKATIDLTADQPVDVLCVYSNISAMEKSMSQPALMRGLVSAIPVRCLKLV